MPSEHASAELLHALSKLHGRVQQASLGLETDSVSEARRIQAAVLDQLSDYVLPRLVQLNAPLVAVVGGSTGTGKSTLVNSIVGGRVTEAGVLRPTTRSPVLVHHPEDAEWFQPDRILPEMPRTSAPTNDTNALRLAPSNRVPRGLAILDAPDVDSIDQGNREIAAQLLAAADLWLFVTSAARYADEVPWDYLRSAAERSTSVAVILDRTQPESIFEVRGHLARMMTSRGLSDSPLFTVPESETDADGLLPSTAVTDIRAWLHDLAADPAAREQVITQTLDGAIRQNVFSAHDIADLMGDQISASTALNGELDDAYRQAAAGISVATTDGSLLRGELLARWQEFVGTGELLRSVEEKVGRIRDRLLEGVAGKRTRSTEVTEALAQGLSTLLVEHAESAAESIARDWNSAAAGRHLLESTRGLERASHDFRNRAERTVRDWQQSVFELVRTEGADKRMTAKFLAFGVNGIGVALMIVMLSQAAVAEDDEIGGGTARIGRKLLDAIFGEETVQGLAQRVHLDLDRRVAALLDGEKRRYGELLDGPEEIAVSQSLLREAAQEAEYARHADFLGDQGAAPGQDFSELSIEGENTL